MPASKTNQLYEIQHPPTIRAKVDVVTLHPGESITIYASQRDEMGDINHQYQFELRVSHKGRIQVFGPESIKMETFETWTENADAIGGTAEVNSEGNKECEE